MPKPVRLRRLAADDVEAAVDHLLAEASDSEAARLVDAVERALRHVGLHPLSGSLRFSYELDVPELRAWPLAGFPFLVFYVERDRDIDVWRILHTRRDIPSTIADARSTGLQPERRAQARTRVLGDALAEDRGE